jgi:hypothetical protein
MATMFKLATTNPLCCCLPKMLPNGVRLGFSRVGEQPAPPLTAQRCCFLP